MKLLPRFLPILAVLLALAAPAGRAIASGKVDIDAEPCFAGMRPGAIYPVAVTLHNNGDNLDGVLTVRADTYTESVRTYDYPVSLPTGAEKTVVVYPATQNYTSTIDLVYQAGRERDEAKLPIVERDYQSRQIGLIGDEIGGLAGIKWLGGPANPRQQQYYTPPANSAGANLMADCYAQPQAAPDRSSGYQNLSTLVVTNGAERLNPAQWQAIKEWVMSGGSLILTGGAGAAYLRAPDAQELVPVSDPTESTLPDLDLPSYSVPQNTGPVSITTGPLKPGATAIVSQAGKVLLARRSLGLGNVLLVGFNPLDAPFRGTPGERSLLARLVMVAAPASSIDQLNEYASSLTAGNGAGYYTVRRYPYYSSYSYGAEVDPFRVRLPPVTMIAGIFLVYFLLAVPVSYLILRRMNRLNLAWITGPALAVLCAYGFYLFTADLYKAGMSRRTNGVVVASAGLPDAVFQGTSDLFFPRGGVYHLTVPDAQSLEEAPINDEYGYPGYSSGGAQDKLLETVDNGFVDAPDFAVGNLAFRRLYYTQPVSEGGSVTAQVHADAHGVVSGFIRNGTDWTLTKAAVILPNQAGEMEIGTLAPGETKTVSGPMSVFYTLDERGGRHYQGNSSPAGSLGAVLLPQFAQAGGAGHAYLVAWTDGRSFGPPLGHYVGGPESVLFFASLD